MSRFAELQAAAVAAQSACTCEACVSDVDQAQAALSKGVKSLTGMDLRDHREVVGAALYVIYAHLRDMVQNAGPLVRDDAHPLTWGEVAIDMLTDVGDAVSGVVLMHSETDRIGELQALDQEAWAGRLAASLERALERTPESSWAHDADELATDRETLAQYQASLTQED